MKTQKARLTEGSIMAALVRLSLPMLIGLIAGMTYGIADSYWIGRLGNNSGSLATIQQSALAQIYQIDFLMIKLALGLGMGVTVIVSQSIGENKWGKAQNLTFSAVILAAIIAILICILGLLSIDIFFGSLHVDEQVIVYVKKYMIIWYPSIIFMIVPIILNSSMRASGNAMYPGMVMLGGSLLNLVLDPLFIFGIGPLPFMGISGAAAATFIARLITFILSIYFAQKIGILNFKKLPFQQIRQLWRQIANIAIPTTLTQAIAPIAGIIMIGLVNSYGTYDAAGFGPAFKISILFIAPLMALGAMIGPFTGQNLGAKKYDRIFEALKKSMIFAFIWGIIVAIILHFTAQPLAPLFNDNPKAFWSFRFYLAITSWSVTAIGINMIWLQFLNATQRAKTGTFLTLIQLFAVTIPIAFWATKNNIDIIWVYIAMLLGQYVGLALFSIFGLKRVIELKGKAKPLIYLIVFGFIIFTLIAVLLYWITADAGLFSKTYLP